MTTTRGIHRLMLWVGGLMLGIIGLVTPAQGGVPVFDATAHATRVKQLVRVIEQIATANAMLSTSREQLQALTGSRGYGQFAAAALRSALPSYGGGITELLSGGSGQGEAFDVAVQLQHAMPLAVATTERSAGGGEFHNSIVRLGQGTEAIGRVAYAELVRDLDAVTLLTTMIDNAHDPKAALDLQSRLLAQNAKSLVVTGKILAAAEIARAKRQQRDSALALEMQRMVTPQFINPRLGRVGLRAE